MVQARRRQAARLYQRDSAACVMRIGAGVAKEGAIGCSPCSHRSVAGSGGGSAAVPDCCAEKNKPQIHVTG